MINIINDTNSHNVETINSTDKVIKRRNKQEMYDNERKKLLAELLDILKISENNKIFYVDDLDNSKILQKKILDLEMNVKKYFTCSSWPFFAKKNISKPYLSLLKSILKDMSVKFSLFSVKDSKTQKNIRQGFKIE